MLGIPVDRSAELQTTGLGAAMLAGLGVGVWSTLGELRATRHSSGDFRPRPIAPEAHGRWRRAVDRARDWARD